ncbi:CMP-N-acetylneuraminate-beta-galactosamide-alpha-2,3-sialyltransferase 2-like [Pelodytes ibericus]
MYQTANENAWLHRERTVWIAPVVCIIFFLIYLSFFSDNSNPLEHIGKSDNHPCECGRCKLEPKKSEWYEKRFNKTIEPLLVGKEQGIPEYVQKWWLRLQSSNDAKAIPEILDKLFKVVPTGNPFEEQDNRPCRTCAVVGNSGNLKGSLYGNKIDSHGLIFRMNGARTSGFEADVGSRTTHHFMYPESAVNLPEGVHLVLIPFKLKDLMWIASALTTGEIKFTYRRVKQFIKADKDKILIFNPGFFQYIHDNWTNHHGKYPSTGIMSIIFAIHICDKVSVFGFGADKQGYWHHYWEKNRGAGAFLRTGVHNASFESLIISKLQSEGKLKFYK